VGDFTWQAAVDFTADGVTLEVGGDFRMEGAPGTQTYSFDDTNLIVHGYYCDFGGGNTPAHGTRVLKIENIHLYMDGSNTSGNMGLFWSYWDNPLYQGSGASFTIGDVTIISNGNYDLTLDTGGTGGTNAVNPWIRSFYMEHLNPNRDIVLGFDGAATASIFFESFYVRSSRDLTIYGDGNTGINSAAFPWADPFTGWYPIEPALWLAIAANDVTLNTSWADTGDTPGAVIWGAVHGGTYTRNGGGGWTDLGASVIDSVIGIEDDFDYKRGRR
jgi:hypothetical protein